MLDSLRQPKYTGANRCLPCTILNVVLALAVGGVIAAVSIPAAVGTVLVAVLLTMLRGYFLPGTPWFTRRYLPASLRRRLGTKPATPREYGLVSTDGGSPVDAEEVEDSPETALRRANVVTDCETVDDLCLTEAFDTARREALADLETDTQLQRETVANLIDADRSAVELYWDDPTETVFVEVTSGEDVEARTYPSRAAFLADLAAARAIENRWDGFQALPVDARENILTGLRAFLDSCPNCGGSLVTVDEGDAGCCGLRNVATIQCPDCESLLVRGAQPMA